MSLLLSQLCFLNLIPFCIFFFPTGDCGVYYLCINFSFSLFTPYLFPFLPTLLHLHLCIFCFSFLLPLLGSVCVLNFSLQIHLISLSLPLPHMTVTHPLKPEHLCTSLETFRYLKPRELLCWHRCKAGEKNAVK